MESSQDILDLAQGLEESGTKEDQTVLGKYARCVANYESLIIRMRAAVENFDQNGPTPEFSQENRDDYAELIELHKDRCELVLTGAAKESAERYRRAKARLPRELQKRVLSRLPDGDLKKSLA